MDKKTPIKRQHDEDIHDLARMLVDAKAWIDKIDKKVQEIMMHSARRRKGDKDTP